MDYSKSLKTECRRSALGSVQEKIMADLMAIGWRDVNAYVAAYGYNAQYSDDYNKQQIEKITSRPEFQKYLEKTRKRYSRDSDEASDDDFDPNCVSKEQTLKELSIAKKKAAIGSKEWLEINKQIIEVTQMKKDEVKDEDNTIHYYLPLSCYQCELHVAHQKKIKKS